MRLESERRTTIFAYFFCLFSSVFSVQMLAGASLHLPQSFTYNKNNNNKNKRQHLPRLPGLHPHNEQQLPHATGRRAKGAKSEETQPDEARHLRDGQSLLVVVVVVSPFVGVEKFSVAQNDKCNSEYRFGQEITSPRRAARRVASP